MDSPVAGARPEMRARIPSPMLQAERPVRRAQTVRRLVRNRAALAGAIIVAIFAALALLAFVWTPYPADIPVLDQRLGSPAAVVGRSPNLPQGVHDRFDLVPGVGGGVRYDPTENDIYNAPSVATSPGLMAKGRW